MKQWIISWPIQTWNDLLSKGKREVHKLSSGERAALVTVVSFMSANRQFIPSLRVFLRTNMWVKLLMEYL